jgi:hypothetical protein
MKLQILLATVIAACSLPLYANPFDKGDVAAGKALTEHQCSTCHIERFGGDGSKIYTRADRKIKTAAQLQAQIARCNKMAKTNLTYQEQLDIGAFLDRNYYKFPR